MKKITKNFFAAVMAVLLTLPAMAQTPEQDDTTHAEDKTAQALVEKVDTLHAEDKMAQAPVEMADTMRAEGKIYVVVAIILIVLIGLVTYLFLLDRKVKKLEDKLGGKP